MKFSEIREACCNANRRLPKTGLVDLTFGNVSVLDPHAGIFAIKPSGVRYEELTPESMVLVDLEGRVVEGTLRPSSDTPTHCRLLQAWGKHGVCAIVHTHSRNAVAFAQAGRDLPCLGTTHSDYFNGAVPVTRAMVPEEVGHAYEWETGNVILERFSGQDPLQIPAVLVQHHGPFAWGVTAEKAVETALALEVIADMAMKSLSLYPALSDVPSHLQTRHFFRKHGANAYYGQ